MSGASSEDVKTSKHLSFVLRHKPESLGPGGWVDVDELLRGLSAAGKPLTRPMLGRIVETSEKQRFALSADGKRIRANQGHSVTLDLALPSVQPPDRLFHGTATRFLESIEREGLRPGRRQHVHLSASAEVARAVGARHGTPVVLVVEAGAMWRAGCPFFLAANGVWLSSHVPPDRLARASEV